MDNEQKKILAVILSATMMFGGLYLLQEPPDIEPLDQEPNLTFIRSYEMRETINPGERDERNYTFKYSEYMDAKGNIYLEVDRNSSEDKNGN